MRDDWVALSRLSPDSLSDQKRTTARIVLGRAVAHNYQWAVYLRMAVARALENGLTAGDIHEIVYGERSDDPGSHRKPAAEIADSGLSTEAIWEYPVVVAGGRTMVRRLQQEANEDFGNDVDTLRRAHSVATQAAKGRG